MARPQEEGDGMGEIVPFPLPEPTPEQQRGEVEQAGPVLDAEFVDENEPVRRGLRDVAPVRVIRHATRQGGAGHAALRTAVQIGYGHGVWASRIRDAATHGAIREQIRGARAAGDAEALATWLAQLDVAKNARRQRIRELPRTIRNLLLAVLVTVTVLMGLLLIAGVSVQVSPGGWTWGEWWTLVGDALGVVGLLVTIAVHIVLWGAVPAWLVAAYRAGRGQAPAWMPAPALADGVEGRDIIPTDGSILEALRNLGIPKLDQAFKRGWGSVGHPTQVFEQGCMLDGRGYRCRIRLPQGVTVEMINRRKDVLAHNLVRLPVEVWPTEPRDRPGVLDLWVANQGALSGPVPAWPLLADLDNANTDYFKGVPVGVNIRGEQVNGLLSETNYAMAGMMGSGKSTLVITLLLGALLDPLVDADVFVMAENADYDPLRPRLRSLVTGAGPSTVEACMATLREAYDDLDVRGKALREHDQRAVTRALAEKDERLRPRIIVFDEVQALFLDEDHGETAVDLTVKLISAARKYAYTLVFLTPEPSSASLPRKVMAVIRCKACFAIGDQQSNDAILGTGSYKAGISAVSLEPMTDESPGDVGTAMTKGFMAKAGLLRSHYVNQGDAHRVTARALQIRERAGITTAQRGPAERRDLLEDLAEVLGSEEVRAADVPALLAQHAPGWQPYRTLNGKALIAQLAKLGVQVPRTNNVHPVRLEAVQTALARRATEDLDDE